MSDFDSALKRIKTLDQSIRRINKMQDDNERSNPEELGELSQILFADTSFDKKTKIDMACAFVRDIEAAIQADKCDRPDECFDVIADMFRQIEGKQH